MATASAFLQARSRSFPPFRRRHIQSRGFEDIAYFEVENIREALRDIRCKDLLTIETVSQFYGEKSVVIFSLVKSEVGGYSDEKVEALFVVIKNPDPV